MDPLMRPEIGFRLRCPTCENTTVLYHKDAYAFFSQKLHKCCGETMKTLPSTDAEDDIALDVPAILERRTDELPISNCAQLPNSQVVE